MKTTLIIAMIGIMVFVAGCTQPVADDHGLNELGEQTTVALKPIATEPSVAEVQNIRDIEILMEKDYLDDDMRGCELWDNDDPEDGCDEEDIKEAFFPQSYKVAQGDLVRMTFMLDAPHVISIDGYGIVDEIQFGTIEFDADKTGTFSVYCHDCHNTDVAQLIVQ